MILHTQKRIMHVSPHIAIKDLPLNITIAIMVRVPAGAPPVSNLQAKLIKDLS